MHEFSNVMKKFILLVLVLSFPALSPSLSFAQPTPKNNTIPEEKTIEKINDKVDELKNKVASRVAELNLVEKRGIIGSVEKASDTQITLNDLKNKRRIIDVDELTKFYSADDKSFGISDIKKGMKISAIGLYNRQSQRLLARFINEVTIPLFLSGVISEIDDKNFTITLITEDSQYLVDIEKVTKTYLFSKGELEATGFSKLEILQNAIVLGYQDPKEDGRITGGRVIVFPNLPKNPKVLIEEESSTPTPSGPGANKSLNKQ